MSTEKIFSTAEPLDASLVERGTVFKCLIRKTDTHETSLLTLTPFSKIREHSHLEAEKFVNVKTWETLVFLGGEPHCLENTSGDVQYWVSEKFSQ